MRIHATILGLGLLLSSPAAAEAGDLLGRAVDMKSGEPVELVTVTLLTEEGKALSTTMTDESGRFRFRGVREETVELALSRVAYKPRRLETIALEPEGDTEVTVELEAEAFVVAPIVVSASRRREITTSAPAAVTTIESEDLEGRQSFTPLDVLRRVEGVQFTQKGVTSSTWIIRGSGGAVMNRNNLVLQDWRSTRMAAFAFNLPYHVSAITPDIERLEVVRGPAGVMFGPEAGTAVIHVLTKSPFESPGTSLSIGGGNQSLMEGWGRHAGLFSSKLGYKLSLRYLKAEDWTPDRNSFGADKANKDVEHLNGNALLEWRLDDKTRLHLAGGHASALKVLEQTTVLYAEWEDFSQSFVHARLHRGRMMANLVYNENHTGDGVFIPYGVPVKENSRQYSAQLHNSGDVRTGRIVNRFTYGVDLRTTNVRTDSTLTRRREDNDTVTEIGAFLQTKTVVSQDVDLFGAIRVDYHDRVDDGAIFPFRLGAAYKVSPSHTFRLVMNQVKPVDPPGFLFQDLPNNQPRLRGFDWSYMATLKGGWNFERDEEGRPLMRSRFVEGGVADYGAADATRTWEAIQADYPELAGVPAPTPGEVATQLATYDQGARRFDSTAPSDVVDLDQPGRSTHTDLELGYTGWIDNRIRVDAAAWMRRTANAGVLGGVITPNVFFDEETLAQYLIDQNLNADQADSLAQVIADRPMGTVAPREVGASDEVISSTFLIPGEGSSDTDWGLDMGAAYHWPSGWLAGLNYSWRPPRSFVEGQSLPAHPHSVGSARVAYNPDRSGLRGSVEVRGQTRKYMSIQLWKGEVPGFVVADVNLGYRPASLPQMGFYLNVSNVLNKEHVEVFGGKILGRLITGRIQLDL